LGREDEGGKAGTPAAAAEEE